MPNPPKFFEIVQILTESEAEVILVGGMAAILHGSPVMTEDIDFVYSPSPENIARLMQALTRLNAHYRDPAGRHIVPNEYKLRTHRINLLDTRYGRLDLLRTIGNNLDYDFLVGSTSRIPVDGIPIRVLNLDLIIQSKEEANRPKDRYALTFLRELAQTREGS